RDVGQLVFVSVSGNINLSCPLIDAKRSVEAYLIQSGVSYTILRYSAFFETWLGPLAGFDHVNHTATVLGNGQQRLSYISEADAARFAAACAGRAGARNRTIELGGPDAITPHEAIAVFERVSGTRYTVQNISLDALQAQYAAAEHPTQKSFAALMLALASDDVIPMAATAAEFGITPRPLADVAHELVPISAH
ncbi:MAG: SDR family oxidoreductase, partial [Gemmatimonadota bacterium]